MVSYLVQYNNNNLSLIEETARRVVQDIAISTGEDRPKIEGESWLANYHYLHSLIFDQLGGGFEYVGNKSCIRSTGSGAWGTAFSNNIMKTGKHYVSFDVSSTRYFLVGVVRPGTLINRTSDINPIQPSFFRQNYFQSTESLVYNTNNGVHCCMYYESDGACYSRHWHENTVDDYTRDVTWRESFSDSEGKLGLLLDLDEGTLSVYKNGHSLGVVKRGLTGHYCWVVSILGETQVTIKREKVPAS